MIKKLKVITGTKARRRGNKMNEIYFIRTIPGNVGGRAVMRYKTKPPPSEKKHSRAAPAVLNKEQKVQVCDATEDEQYYKSRLHKKNAYIPGAVMFFAAIFISLTSPAQTQKNIVLHFSNKAGEKLLQPDSSYSNAFGEVFTVRNFRYYISNILLKDSVHNQVESYNERYFLVDEEDSASKKIGLVSALQQITSVEFLLGVDSVKNVSGVQTGTLDPARGMFWTWNSGYIMAKLEGRSPAAKAPGHAFSYHIGGYKPGEAAAKKIQLALPANAQSTTQINITADVLKWFTGRHDIRIANMAFCHEPGKAAMRFADNYAGMFSIEHTQ